MIIDQKKTTIAYRCPGCGGAVKSVVGVFTLTGDMIKLKCPCGKSELKISYTSDGKIRLSVPCYVCGKDHEFILSRDTVFSREIIVLSCALSGLDICFIGEREKVEVALEEDEKALKQLLEENDALDYFDGDEEEEPGKLTPDLAYLPLISTVVKELMEDGKIYCGCSVKQGTSLSESDVNNVLLLGGEPVNNCNGDIELVVRYESFAVRCCSCGREYRIREEDCDKFCDIDELVLSKK